MDEEKKNAERFFGLNEEILNSFFNKEGNIINEQILEKLAEELTFNSDFFCNVFNKLKDIKELEKILNDRIERVKEIYQKYPIFTGNEKIKNYLSLHRKIFFDKNDNIIDEKILDELNQAVNSNNNLDNIFKDVENLKNLQLNLLIEREKLNISEDIKGKIRNITEERLNYLLEKIEQVDTTNFTEDIKKAIKEKIINIFLMLNDLDIKKFADENNLLVFRVFRILVDENFNERIKAFVQESKKNCR